MPPSIAIIITCFNLERFIGAAVESALAQNYDGLVEIVVVDDCSTDRSPEIIRSFPDVRYVRTARQSGVLLATLEGLAATSAEIVCLLDGDDIWRADKVRQVAACFDRDEQVVLVTHDLDFVDGDGQLLARVSRPEEVLTPAGPEQRRSLVRSGILLHDDFVWLGSALSFRRASGRIEEFAQFVRGLPDPANTYQDWPLAFWLASLPNQSCDYVAEKLFSYRLHGVNHSGDASNPAKAIRNFRRTGNTVSAMREIALSRALPRDVVSGLNARAHFCDHVVKVYSGRSAGTAVTWARNLPYMVRKGIFLKESIRWLGVQLLGAQAFARISSSRRVLRRLPLS